MKKSLFFVACILLIMQSIMISAKATDIDMYEDVQLEARYQYIERCSISLNYDSNVARCWVDVLSSSNTNRISGTITLYDETLDFNVGSWNFNQVGNSYTFLRNVSVQSGHEYTLFLNGMVYMLGGGSEEIQTYVTRRN